jgi:hypothetical protein
LSTRESGKSSTETPTGAPEVSPSSRKPASPYGNSLKKGFLNGIYRSTKTGNLEYYESSYELRRFKALDESPLVKSWGRSKAKIRYRMGRRKKRYHPDIFVVYEDGRIFLEEIKGYIFSKRQYLKKKMMAEAYCKFRGWIYRVIFEEDLEKVE